MHAPQPKRKSDVIQKLQYSCEQHSLLVQSLIESYETDHLPKFVSLKAEDILSNTRECFDYLAQDLIEGYLLPTAEETFVQNYQAGKLKVYFPFFESQLTAKQSTWNRFNNSACPVFEKIKELVNAMDSGLSLAGTSCNAKDFRVIQQLVNEKKHSQLTKFESLADGSRYYKGAGGSAVLDKATAENPLTFMTGFGEHPKTVPEFRFIANNREVKDLCLFAVVGTRTIMDWFYETFFFQDGNRINPPAPTTEGSPSLIHPSWKYDDPREILGSFSAWIKLT